MQNFNVDFVRIKKLKYIKHMPWYWRRISFKYDFDNIQNLYEMK